MSTDEVLRFYAVPGPLTAAEAHRREPDELPDGLEEVVSSIRGLGIYDVVAADFYGIEVPGARAQEIHCRSIDEILDGLLALDSSSLANARPPERRLFMRCSGFTKLLVSALRARERYPCGRSAVSPRI